MTQLATVSPQRHALSRDFVVRSVLKLFDEVESQKRWGAVTIVFQAGYFKTIKKEETITEDQIEHEITR